MEINGKIHFITCVELNNCGDYQSSPLNYYYDFFKDYCLVYHDINSVRFALIQKNDVVILGGGGLLDNLPDWNQTISKVLDIGAFVIGWSVGFHKRLGFQPATKDLDFEKFGLLAVRDFEHETKLPWLPCVTCMSPYLWKTGEIKRNIGIISHRFYPISGLPYEKMDNQASFDDITDFIASSDVIITSSYHAAYWAMLMGKIVICTNEFSYKFYHFKHKPQFLSRDHQTEQGVEDCIAKAKADPLPASLLQDYIALSNAFFLQAKQEIEQRIPVSNPQETMLYVLKTAAELSTQNIATQQDIKRHEEQYKRAEYLTHPGKVFQLLKYKLKR